MKNPVSAELMHIYLIHFHGLLHCFYEYRNLTHSKVTGSFLVNPLHAFHRFNRCYQPGSTIFILFVCLFCRRRFSAYSVALVCSVCLLMLIISHRLVNSTALDRAPFLEISRSLQVSICIISICARIKIRDSQIQTLLR